MKKKPLKKPIHKIEFNKLKMKMTDLLIDDRIEYSNVSEDTLNNVKNHRIVVDSAVFDKCTFNNSEFDRSEFMDVVFKNCEITNSSFYNSSFIRCEFIKCKMIGTHFVKSLFTDVLIKDSVTDYFDVSDCKIKSLKIVDTSQKMASWFDNNLDNIIFDNVDFERLSLSNSPLKNVDLSNSNIDKLKTDLISIKGITIDKFQTVEICNLLGVNVI